MSDLLAPGLGEDVRFTTVESRDDAMRGADRPGAGIEDLADTEEEETRDRAFASPKERLFILMNAREALNKMTSDELAELSLSLDAPMLATLQHILANPMYKEGLEENVGYSWLPRGIAQEYIKGIDDLIARHGEEKVARAYKNAGGSARQVAPMRDIEAML
jgi:hypothetical protein